MYVTLINVSYVPKYPRPAGWRESLTAHRAHMYDHKNKYEVQLEWHVVWMQKWAPQVVCNHSVASDY